MLLVPLRSRLGMLEHDAVHIPLAGLAARIAAIPRAVGNNDEIRVDGPPPFIEPSHQIDGAIGPRRLSPPAASCSNRPALSHGRAPRASRNTPSTLPSRINCVDVVDDVKNPGRAGPHIGHVSLGITHPLAFARIGPQRHTRDGSSMYSSLSSVQTRVIGTRRRADIVKNFSAVAAHPIECGIVPITAPRDDHPGWLRVKSNVRRCP